MIISAKLAVMAVSSVPSVTLAADAVSDSPITEWVQLVNLPLSILILYGFARGWFVTGKEHQRVIDERNEERIERKAAQAVLTEKIMPALQDNEKTMSDVVKTVERIDSRRRGS